MRVSEVLNLKPADIEDQKLLLHDPKSGREQEVVFIPKKISRRLQDYIREHCCLINFSIVKFVEKQGVELRWA